AQYRELEAFSAFGSDLDKASQSQLDRGARLVELLKQGQYEPFPVAHEVVSIWAGTTGQLDDIEVADVRAFETELLSYLKRQQSHLLDTIAEGAKLSDDTVAGLEQAVAHVKQTFRADRSDAAPTVVAPATVPADTSDEA
ncbi:MAG TPA: F0F1 ATP synthase subunit alpha, partial [Mycobacteriales bacterium]|nr:F0F1 ATP synthase subunit alpha [Mycobacteriales bacterium]